MSDEECQDEDCDHEDCWEDDDSESEYDGVDYAVQLRNYLPVLQDRADAYNEVRDATVGSMSFFLVLAGLSANPFLVFVALIPFKIFLFSILMRDMYKRQIRDSKKYIAQIEQSTKVD